MPPRKYHKVGDKKEQKIIGNFGLGDKNDNGERLVEFCQRQNLMISNIWFEKKESSRHTWTSPDGKTKNQIDFILVSQRYRNSIKNSKARADMDCGSDYKPIVMRYKTTFNKLRQRK